MMTFRNGERHRRQYQSETTTILSTCKHASPISLNDTLTTTSTAQNAENSRLFRLPPELRNTVWDLLHGDRDVKVCFFHQSTGTGVRTIKYHIYDRYRGTKQYPREVDRPITTSKQYWAETTSVFFSSAVFDFESADAFRMFTTEYCRHAFISRITRLRIRSKLPSLLSSHKEIDHFWSIWAASLNAVTLGQFEGLQGLEWSIVYLVDRQKQQIQKLSLHDAGWDSSKLMLIIKALQQRRLRPGLTSVRFLKKGNNEMHPESDGLL
jgi:hypothetical protein